MDAFSPAQLLPISFEKPTPTCFLSHSQNHTFNFFFSTYHVNPGLRFISKFRTPQSLLNTSSLAPGAVDKIGSHALREICEAHVPRHILDRMEEIGYVMPTDVQRQALPSLLSGRDCILHAQTGSGKTLAYVLLIYSVIDAAKSAVQALVVVPTRELGMQVAKVARMLAASPTEVEKEHKSYTVMALLDGGTLRRHKSWLKVDFIFNSSKQVSSLRKLLTLYSSCNNRQTVFASASIPQHRRFLHDCVQQKWTKSDVVHIHVSPVEPMPSRLHHRFVVCHRNKKQQTLLSLIQSDAPESGIIFASEQSKRSKQAGNAPSTSLLVDFLKTSYQGSLDILLLEEDMNFNSRAVSLLEARKGGGYLLVATDIASRGVDLPEMSHIYNFDLPKTAIDYLHRAGRTCRKPFSDMKCTVTTIIVPEERFVLQKYENELMFNCEELTL
ncbi:DEAD-box ATP-dependent RNA helicase 58, chloroplastic-like isoform X4 [Neltuma alba]|uniref:DEAD-box ATP-dependent RNA helicase 58, chloroplastic-like isoform X4 n=1 Tax=Neltuma alba TaxID=207710 RepID=UPI0010A48E0B|nr:DEAD-box ATP-dependent RNA helicase 58, chloroplastic-like isoform X4 [Prosopis alba]